MFTATHVILGLKLAVGLVTILFVASIIAIASGRRKLHGRINLAFFCLTMTAVLAFEVIIHFINPHLTAQFTPEEQSALRIHLCFSIPSAIVLPFMLFTGPYFPRVHKPLAVLFTLLWAGTFYTGIFTLPHRDPDNPVVSLRGSRLTPSAIGSTLASSRRSAIR